MKKLYIENYYELNLDHHKPAMRCIQNISLKGNERILDIGCGDGKLTAEISLLVPNGSVLGIDASEEIIDFAKSKFPNTIYSNLDFEVGDAQNLAFKDEFDIVVSFACLHAIANHTPILRGIYASLKKHGRLIMQFSGKAKSTDVESLVLTLLNSDKWKSKLADKVEYGFFEVQEYCSILNACGLYPEKVDLCNQKLTYQGKADFSFVTRNSWLSLSSRIPNDLYPNFIEDLVELYIQHNPPDYKGTIHARCIWLEVNATKM